ncbi:MAG: hypothetical protein ACI8QH_001194, partial [Flammeovirgaceae bacterium]
ESIRENGYAVYFSCFNGSYYRIVDLIVYTKIVSCKDDFHNLRGLEIPKLQAPNQTDKINQLDD